MELTKELFIEKFLKPFVLMKGTDVHISPENFLSFRVNGKIIQQRTLDKLDKNNTNKLFDILLEMLEDEEMSKYNKEKFDKEKHIGFSIQTNIEGENYRFRVNVSQNDGGKHIVMRMINAVPPKLESLGFNKKTLDGLKYVASRQAGLFLVVGATGSGKSTTLASLIRYINEEYDKSIITLEDPIEYRHISQKSIIVQKELGRDIKTFSNGLKSALREDPDIILVGEIRDEETLDLALKASETGHIVFGTLHTQDAVATVQRLTAMSKNEKLTRERLASVLIGVIAQKLFVSVLENKRKILWEMLISDAAVSAMIREGKDTNIKSAIDVLQYSQSFNKTIQDYLINSHMNEELAFNLSPDVKALKSMLEDVNYKKENKKSSLDKFTI